MDRWERWKQYAFVVEQLTGRELKRKYARSLLGVVWSLLHPLLSMGLLSLIFSHMFRRSIENYPIYYLTGYLVWQTFTLATSSSVTALADNRSLLLKVRFPLELFLLGKNAAAFVNLGWSFLAYLVMLLVFRVPVGLPILLWLPVGVCLFFFSLGLSLLLAAAFLFFGDIKHLYGVILTLWMYCSALFYPVEQLPPVMAQVVGANPLYQMIACLRGGVLEGRWPGPGELLAPALWAAAVFGAGLLAFRRLRPGILRRL